MESSREGMRALWISLGVLGVTALAQAVVVVFSGSVALLGDTLHNVADALTAVPLGDRVRARTPRRDPALHLRLRTGRGPGRGGHRADDRACPRRWPAYEAIRRLLHPRTVTNLGWVAAAAVVGFIGNELVARYRIRVGPPDRLGGAGRRRPARPHRRVHLAGRGARRDRRVGRGSPLADPIVGLLITVAILLRAAGRGPRGLPPADGRRRPRPARPRRAGCSPTCPALQGRPVRLRWIGHQLHADGDLVVRPDLTLAQAHQVTVAAEQHLTTTIPRLTSAVIHPDPAAQAGREHHAVRPADSEQRA